MGTSVIYTLPAKARILSCDFQPDSVGLSVWYVTKEGETMQEARHFHIVKTGEQLPDELFDKTTFIGTARRPYLLDKSSDFVVHLFEGKLDK